MKQYIYVVRLTRPDMLVTGPNEKEMATLARHSQYLDELTAAGRVYVYGRTQTTDANTFGLVIYDAANDEEAAAIMNADPAIAEGVMAGTLSPYQIVYMRK